MTGSETDALAAILEALARIERALERLTAASPQSPADWRGALLVELARMPVFSAKSALQRAAKDEDLGRLLAAYAAKRNAPMALGRVFAQMARDAVVSGDGHMLVRRGDVRGSPAYCVRTCRASNEESDIEQSADMLREVRKQVARRMNGSNNLPHE